MKFYIIGALALACVGCATIVKGTSQVVTLSTPGANGAVCTLTSPAITTVTVTTPGSVTLEKSKENIAVICTRRCFQDGSGVIASSAEITTAGNLLIGGVIGLGVDAAGGAMHKYNADNQIVMVPIPGCARRRGD